MLLTSDSAALKRKMHWHWLMSWVKSCRVNMTLMSTLSAFENIHAGTTGEIPAITFLLSWPGVNRTDICASLSLHELIAYQCPSAMSV